MKVAVVTGANRGLGLGFAQVLASNGYRVYAAMRSIEDSTGESNNIVPVELDVVDDASIKRLAKRIADDNQTVSLLINNAGLNKDTVANNKEVVCKLDQLDRGALNKMFDVNSTGPLILAKHIVPLMEDDGLILNISSNRGSFHDENENSSANYGYRASKTALNMFTLALSEDLPRGISTVAVHPGGVKTDMNPYGPAMPTEAARDIYENIIKAWKPEMDGGFYRTDGTKYPY